MAEFFCLGKCVAKLLYKISCAQICIYNAKNTYVCVKYVRRKAKICTVYLTTAYLSESVPKIKNK